MRLKQTWRWFGPEDPVTLADIRQTGAEGIVTALHHVPHGELWTVEEIMKRKQEIEAAGLTWDVVESLTVHEDIKTRTGQYAHWTALYQQSLRNLAQCGIRIVTYNFMPVNDWTRTSLDHPMPDGSKALYFNWTDMALFDIHILERPDAQMDYPQAIVEKAKATFDASTETEREHLAWIVRFGIPGERKLSLAEMREKIAMYKGMGHDVLRDHLVSFLQDVAPVADEYGIKLAIHPDDPPYDILGIPRIMKNMEDYAAVFSRVPNKSNGACFCTGSLGASFTNDLPAIAKQMGERIHFVHLRNVRKDEEGNFFEADHLDGDTDMHAVMKELLAIQQTQASPIPFRPDHGHQMLDDLDKTTNPGYSCIGRMRGLAELRGLQLGILRENRWTNSLD